MGQDLAGARWRTKPAIAWARAAGSVSGARWFRPGRVRVSACGNIAAKMVEGAVNKFLGEITLQGQPFVKDDKQTVEKMLAAKKAKVNGYAFFVVGEGIEKKSTDFAAEVMAQAGKAH